MKVTEKQRRGGAQIYTIEYAETTGFLFAKKTHTHTMKVAKVDGALYYLFDDDQLLNVPAGAFLNIDDAIQLFEASKQLQ